jgi:uncharacterized protein YdaU (DUF1376 family)
MTTPRLPYYPFYYREYQDDTRHLTLEQDGAYRNLLDYQWRQGWVPTNLATLGQICRGTPLPKMRRIWLAIGPYFPTDPGDGTRCQNEKLERVRARALQKSEAASRSVEHRAWRPHRTQSNVNRTIERTSIERQSNVNLSLNSKEESTTTSSSTARASAVGLPDTYQPDLDAVLRTAGHPSVVLTAIRTLTAGKHPQLEQVTPEDVGEGLRALLLANAPTSKLARFVQTAARIRTDPHPVAGRRRAGAADPVEVAAAWAAKEPAA